MMHDLEFLREVFKDIRLHVGIGTITQLGLATDRSTLRVRVKMLPDSREIIANMTWAAVGANTGDYDFPEVEDMVIVAFLDGHPDDAFVITRCSSKDEQIPVKATEGHAVKYAKTGKKLYLGSSTKVCIGKLGSEPTEPLVLGNVLLSALTDILNAFLNASQVCLTPLGPGFLDPGVRTALVAALSKYVTTASTNVVSQIAFSERGN